MPIKPVADSDFAQRIQSKGLTTLVAFSAEWSVACGSLDDLLSAAKDKYPKLALARLDIDQSPETPAQFAVTVVPALLLFKNGEVVDRVVGLSSAERVLQMLAPHLA